MTCLRVTGNHATVLANLTDLWNPGLAAFTGGGVLIDVVDNGKNEKSPPDLFSNILFVPSQFAGFGGQCPPNGLPPGPIDKGDIKVDDGS